MPATILLFGGLTGGDVYRLQGGNVADAGAPVLLRAITAVWAPNGWLQGAAFRTVTVSVSANVGAPFRLTPIVDGGPLDGTGGQPDARASWTMATPAARQRTTIRTVVGLARPVTIAGSSAAKVGLRGSWIQFLLETTGAVTVPTGETNPDLRVAALSMEVEPLGQTQQAVNA